VLEHAHVGPRSQILKSERLYVANLRLLVELFVAPLKDSPKILPRDAHSALFGDIDNIATLNASFLADIEQRMQTWCAAAAAVAAAAARAWTSRTCRRQG
jgi:hypothetical protein